MLYSPLNNNPTLGKLDIGFFSTYRPEWVGRNILDIAATDVLDRYFVSFVH